MLHHHPTHCRSKDNIKVTVEDGVLTIKGERKHEAEEKEVSLAGLGLGLGILTDISSRSVQFGCARTSPLPTPNPTTTPHTPTKHQEATGQVKWIERSHGSFVRSFGLPDQVDADGIRASVKDGVMTVVVPKKVEAAAKPPVKEIPVETA